MSEKKGVLQVRVSEDEKRGFIEAAAIAGIPLSSWVRERLRYAAIRELEGMGQRVPFIPAMQIWDRAENA